MQKRDILLFSNLPSTINKWDLQEKFAKYGNIDDFKVKGNPKLVEVCTGFVRYENPEDAERAYKELNGERYCGRKIQLVWGKTS